MNTKECQECENIFKPRKRTSKFCGIECAKVYRKKNVIIKVCICSNKDCGIEFSPKPGSTGRYCSQSCAAKVNNTITPKRKPEGECRDCGNPIPKQRATWCDDCLIKRPRPENRTRLILSLEGTAAHPARRGGSNNRCNVFFTKCEICQALFCNHDGKGNNKGRFQTCKSHRGHLLQTHRQKLRHAKIAQEKISSWLSGEWDGAQPCGDLSGTIWNYLRDSANNICQNPTCISGGRPIPTHPSDGRTILEINHINGNGQDHSPDNLEVICPTCHALTKNYRGRNIGSGRPVYYSRVRR